MKKLLSLAMFLIGLLTSCGSDDPYKMPTDEFPPIKLYFTFTDLDGNDLLDPSNPRNVLDGKNYVEYKGEKYMLDSSFEVNPNENDSPANFQGFRLQQMGDRYVVAFGELDGSYYYKDEEMWVVFGNGWPEVLKIYSIWTYKEDGLPDFHRQYKTNSEVEGGNTASPVINVIHINRTDDPPLG